MTNNELVAELRKAALQIASDGHNGWGNLCTLAADRLEGSLATRQHAIDRAYLIGFAELFKDEGLPRAELLNRILSELASLISSDTNRQACDIMTRAGQERKTA